MKAVRKSSAMAKPVANRVVDAQPIPDPERKLASWECFFAQSKPIYRGQLIANLMLGEPIVVERIPDYMLPDVVLFGHACRHYHEAEIVDDWEALLQRVRDVWARPDFTHKLMDHRHLRWVDCIQRGADGFECPEETYIPILAGWYLAADMPDYFGHKTCDECGGPVQTEGICAKCREAQMAAQNKAKKAGRR